MYFKYEEKNYSIERYPSSDNKSLRAWSAADEYLLKYLKESNISYTKPLIYNDRFGFLSTILSRQQPNIIINYKSQEKSLEINLKKHGIDLNTNTSLQNFLMSHKMDGHSEFKVISPVTTVSQFLSDPSILKPSLGIDDSIDVFTFDPVSNKSTSTINDYLYEKGNQLTVIAYTLQNISNNLTGNSDTSQDFFKAISDELTSSYNSSQDVVNIESKEFINSVKENVINLKSLNDSIANSLNITNSLSNTLPIIKVYSEDSVTNAVFNFCLKNKIKLIYSATSASLGNRGKDKNLSPYAFTKAKNLELLENLKKWFNFKYEVIYFYNVYGPHQICKGQMSTVIGIFEDHFKRKKPLPVVKPGTQSRRFTHIEDTINVCFLAWRKNLCRHYSISNKKSYSILEVAKLFDSKFKFLPKRAGERYASALTNLSYNNKVHKRYGKIQLKDYINSFIKRYKK